MSIKIKIVLLLTAFAVVPALLMGIIVFPRERDSIVALRLAQLNNIADLKKDKIETFFRERTGDINSIRNLNIIALKFSDLLKYRGTPSSPVYVSAKAELDKVIKAFQENYGYLDVMLVDTQGVVAYTSGSAHKAEAGGSLRDRKAFEEGRKGVYFTDLEFYNGHYDIMAAAPLNDSNGAFMGEVVIEIDMGGIYHFIGDATGLGNTGEALIVRLEGEGVLFLSPLRSASGAPLRKWVAFGEKKAFPAQKAVSGENGSGVSFDYAGNEVLAAWRSIPSVRWGLVTKISTSEAFEQVSKLKVLLITLELSLLILGIFAAVAVAKSVTGPVLALQKGAEIIERGDLDYEVATDAKDEVGRLSRAFDSMTRHLRSVIEERMRLLESEKKRAAELEALNRELEAFAYSVSHDLRTPLRSIDGFSMVLLEDYADKLDAEGRDYLERVRTATQRMGGLIDDILKLSRVTRADMRRESVDLGEIAGRIARRLAEIHFERRVEVNIREDMHANADGRLLTVLLENLLSNAWKFTEKSAPAVIEFGEVQRDGGRFFFVRDNGVGFDMKYSNKLFQPFQRLHDASEFPGTGIGLATVKRIVERHGGRVWIEGEAGRGTTVYFSLE